MLNHNEKSRYLTTHKANQITIRNVTVFSLDETRLCQMQIEDILLQPSFDSRSNETLGAHNHVHTMEQFLVGIAIGGISASALYSHLKNHDFPIKNHDFLLKNTIFQLKNKILLLKTTISIKKKNTTSIKKHDFPIQNHAFPF